jgi:hypothetical protein
MKLRIPADQAEAAGGFCVDNIFFPPAGSWKFYPASGLAYPPDFQSNPNASTSDPDAPPICFDVVIPGGDVNGDFDINIFDAVFLVDYIFSSGPAPIPFAAGDCNCDGSVDISDVVYLIIYIFSGGSAPCQ